MQYLISTEVLTRWRHFTMQQRCHQLFFDSKGTLEISRTLLLNIYKANGVVRRKASFKFNRRLRSEHQQTDEKIIFLRKLLVHMHAKRQIIYMDETSTHLWEKMKSFWMPKDDLIDVKLNKERGKSITIIGGISNQWDKMKFVIGKKTNIPTVKRFLQHIQSEQGISRHRCVMVMDNHAAHKSDETVNFAHSLGIEILFMPPTASELNPIERMWSYFKRRWRQKLYDPELTITDQNSIRFIEETLREVRQALEGTHGPHEALVQASKLAVQGAD